VTARLRGFNFSGHHQPRKRARLLVFGVSTFLWLPPAPKTSARARFRGLYLSLASQGTQGDERRAYNVRSHFHFFYLMSTNYKTSPNSAPAPKTSGYARFRGFNFSDHHQPRKRARALVFGVSTFLWPARVNKVTRGARTTYVRISIPST